MRSAVFALVGAVGLATAAAVSANAAPAVPSLDPRQGSNFVRVADGCGPGFHRTPWGRCVPHRYGHYRPRAYWRGDGERAADYLNRRELGRLRGY